MLQEPPVKTVTPPLYYKLADFPCFDLRVSHSTMFRLFPSSEKEDVLP